MAPETVPDSVPQALRKQALLTAAHPPRSGLPVESTRHWASAWRRLLSGLPQLPLPDQRTVPTTPHLARPIPLPTSTWQTSSRAHELPSTSLWSCHPTSAARLTSMARPCRSYRLLLTAHSQRRPWLGRAARSESCRCPQHPWPRCSWVWTRGSLVSHLVRGSPRPPSPTHSGDASSQPLATWRERAASMRECR